jgi:nucleoside-diphosphate-sugar epimerase
MYTVLGAKGFIGSRLLAALKKTGATCNAPARGDEKVFTQKLGTVFYCIGLTNDYKDRPHETVEAHASLLNRILEQASFDRLIYLSSTRLYDGLNSTAENADLTLNPANPRHLYDFSKGLGENLCLNASKSPASVARLSSVYDDGPDATGFMPDLLRRLKKERAFALDSSSGIVRDYVHVNDVVEGLIKMAEQTTSEIVNIGSGENVSNQDIVDALNATGCDITLQRQSTRENPPVTDIHKLKALGVNPLPVRSYLQTYLKERQAHAAR